MKYIITEFQYLNLMESVEGKSEITERCWKGYTQKGMKTMFGKRYPNCVKIKKKKSVNEQETISRVLKEESELYKEQLIKLIEKKGVYYAAEFVGGIKNLIDVLGDNLSKLVYNNPKPIFDLIWKEGLENTAELFGGRDNLIKLVGLKELIKILIYFYNDAWFYGDNFNFICDDKNFDEYLDVLTFDATNQHEVSMDYFFGGIDGSFKSILKTVYGDELKSFWDQKRGELCKGRLAEQLLEDEEDFGDEIVSKRIFDRVFDNLNAENDGKGYVKWLLPDIPEGLDDEALEAYIAFSKNYYGRLWIYDCGLYHKLEFIKTFLGIGEEDFYRLLVNYLNDKFSDVVGDRPVQDVGRHYC